MQVHAKEAMPPCLSHYYVVCPPEKKLAVLRALVRRELGVPAAASASAAEAEAGVGEGGAAAAVPGTGPSSGESGAAAERVADRPPGDNGGGGGGSGGGGGGGGDIGVKADMRGLVFALPTKPLEGIAASLDKALGGSGGREGGTQHERGRGGGVAAPPQAEFLREELGLNARVRRGRGPGEAGGRGWAK